jgi:hypothetical protein
LSPAAAATAGGELDARAAPKLGLLALAALLGSLAYWLLGDEEVGEFELAVAIGSLLLAVNGLRSGVRALRAGQRAGARVGRPVLLGLAASGLAAAFWLVGFAVVLAA